MKIINPQGKGSCVIKEWSANKSDSVEAMETRHLLIALINSSLALYYLVTGLRENKQLILCDSDIQDMYSSYLGKQSVRVWLKCVKVQEDARPRKRGRSDDSEEAGSTKRSGYDSHNYG